MLTNVVTPVYNAMDQNNINVIFFILMGEKQTWLESFFEVKFVCHFDVYNCRLNPTKKQLKRESCIHALYFHFSLIAYCLRVFCKIGFPGQTQ